MLEIKEQIKKYDKYKDSGIEWIGKIPESWNVLAVKRLFNIGRGRVIAQTELEYNGIYPVYSSQTQDNGCLGYLASYDFDVSQLTWTTDGANAGTIFLREGKHNCTNVCGTLQPKGNDFNLMFMQHALSYIAYYHKRYDTNGFKIMNNEMSVIKVIIPSLEEQNNIANYLGEKCAKIDETIETEKQVIEKLKEYKQSVITEAVTKGLDKNVQMKDSGIEWIGKIPEHWNISKLNNLFLFVGGFAFKSEDYTEETENQIIRIGNIRNDKLILDDKRVFVSDRIANLARNYIVCENDILFSMTGTKGKRDYFYTLMVHGLKEGSKKLLINQRVGCFRKKYELQEKYYNYLLKDERILDGIFLYETGTANQGNLGIESIKNTKLQLPPIKEQKQISDYLDKKCAEIDDAISHKGQVIEKLTEYKKSLIYECVTGKRKVC